MKGLFRITLGLALVVALAACSSNDSIKRERDQARADAKMYMQQIESIKTALMAAGATGDTVDALVQSLANMVGTGTEIDVAALEAALREAGGEGADITALVNSIVAKLKMEQDEKDKTDMAAMMKTAMKLYAGIGKPMGDLATPAATDRVAGYSGNNVQVRIGDDSPAAEDNITLTEDKKTAVTANHGWAGKRYADPAGGDSYEAIVYSNVEAAKQGKKFGGVAAGLTATGPYQYQLSTAGVLTAAEADGIGETDDAFVAARVAITGVTRTAGTETFKLPEGRPQGEDIITRSGSYHGVAGTYSCDTSDGANTCTAAVAPKGLTLGGTGTWTFKPTNAETRVTDSSDTAYASYGWWLKKAANDGDFTASAFHDFKGTPGAVGIADLVAGTATYVGGAAGKYALASATGGTNDAGHFTARATLEADFEDDTVTGTIDNFMGADGQMRDWSVELKESALFNAGAIIGDSGRTGIDLTGAPTDDDVAQKTVWTLGGTKASASGEWSGNLREEGSDGVPKVATGTFYTEYGTAGRMVGAFGANKQ